MPDVGSGGRTHPGYILTSTGSFAGSKGCRSCGPNVCVTPDPAPVMVVIHRATFGLAFTIKLQPVVFFFLSFFTRALACPQCQSLLAGGARRAVARSGPSTPSRGRRPSTAPSTRCVGGGLFLAGASRGSATKCCVKNKVSPPRFFHPFCFPVATPHPSRRRMRGWWTYGAVGARSRLARGSQALGLSTKSPGEVLQPSPAMAPSFSPLAVHASFSLNK